MLLFLRSFACRLSVVVLLLSAGRIDAQPGSTLLKWTKDGGSYYEVKSGNIVRVDIQDTRETVVIGKELLQPAGRTAPETRVRSRAERTALECSPHVQRRSGGA